MAFSTLRVISFIIGAFLLILAGSMIVPMVTLVLMDEQEHLSAFLWGGLITALVGLALVATGRPKDAHLRPRDMYLLTTSIWMAVCVFAALPMMFLQHLSYTDAFFETMSGITTTGATVLTDLDHTSAGILMWRSLLQWMGGIGFVAMGVAVLPMLRVGGMRLFQTESSDWGEKVIPRSHIAAKYISVVYLTLTCACTLAYWLSGMDVFDAVNHALTTVSTAGFSTADASLGEFSDSAHWVAVVFMLLGALPFVLYAALLRGNVLAMVNDQQVRGFLLTTLAISLAATLWLWLNSDFSFLDSLRMATVNIVSIITTTGFAVGDYSQWGGFAFMLFFYLTFMGGCSGSTTGGLKVFRFQVAFTLLRGGLKQLIHPRAVFKQQYNGRHLDEEIVRSILTFSFFFTITIGVLALALTLLGLDPITALTGAATAVCNVGPGLGTVIGPAGNFSSLPDAAKWLLAAGMLLGRLEIITVLVLLTPTFWRH
jgi:trk system potassium uptake protein TrkH